jgi:hypothetical protein
MGGKNKLKHLQAGQAVEIDPKHAIQQQCAACGNKFFRLVMTVFKVSALVSPTGQELVIQQPVLICTKCEIVLETT